MQEIERINKKFMPTHAIEIDDDAIFNTLTPILSQYIIFKRIGGNNKIKIHTNSLNLLCLIKNLYFHFIKSIPLYPIVCY